MSSTMSAGSEDNRIEAVSAISSCDVIVDLQETTSAASRTVAFDAAQVEIGTVASEAVNGVISPALDDVTECEECRDDDCQDDEDELDDEDANLPFPGFVPTAFYYFDQTKRPRRWCLQLITWPWFERISMCVILLNCITLGMYRPCHDEICMTARCQVLEGFDHFIFTFFAMELCIKAFAMGLIGRGAYLADTWNRLDLFIVLAGVIEYAISMEDLNLSAIRTIRVLRPLRAINRIPSMRILVTLLLDTLPMLGNILLLCFFVFFIFGIVGVQLWSGNLRQRCFLDLPYNLSIDGVSLPSYYGERTDKDFVCSSDHEDGMTKCNEIPAYRYYDNTCNGSLDDLIENNFSLWTNSSSCINWNAFYSSCRPGPSNPFHGSISFDNIGLAWIAIFQVISLAGWVNIMYFIQDAHSFWDWIYFVALIVIGSFFMINLCLVVIATQFSETKKRETEKMWLERRKCASSGTLASVEQLGGCYDEIIRYIGHLGRVFRRQLARLWQKYGCFFRRRRRRRRPPHRNRPVTSGTDDPDGHPTDDAPVRVLRFAAGSSDGETPEPDSAAKGDGPNCGPRANGTGAKKSDEIRAFQTYVVERSSNGIPGHGGAAKRPGRSVEIYPTASVTHGGRKDSLALTSNDEKGTETNWIRMSSICPTCPRKNSTTANKDCWCHDICQLKNSAIVCCPVFHRSDETDDDVTDDEASDASNYDTDSDDQRRHVNRLQKRIWQKICDSVQRCVNSNYFQRGILVAILVNTLSMGIEHHEQAEILTKILEYSNLIFSGLFAVEMLLKIFAEGPFSYIKSGFNLFDGFIVVLSVVELIQGGTGGLSVLRTFRLLRILKLVRFMPALRYQLVIMLKTMDNVATFFSLLVLFIFIFSVLGMHLFGGKFCVHLTERRVCNCTEIMSGLCKCDRKNFDSLRWSIVTVFQILTQEDWQEVLYNGMSKTSQWSALYFIALMTFGNYVLFNLLVAILVEGFSTEGEMEDEDNEEDAGSTDALDGPTHDAVTGDALQCIEAQDGGDVCENDEAKAAKDNATEQQKEGDSPAQNTSNNITQSNVAGSKMALNCVDDVLPRSSEDIIGNSQTIHPNGICVSSLAPPRSGTRYGHAAISNRSSLAYAKISSTLSGQTALPPTSANGSEESLPDNDHEIRCNSISFNRPCRETKPSKMVGDASPVFTFDQSPDGNSNLENASILCPLKNFEFRQNPVRTSLIPHNSFQSYFRPTIPRSRLSTMETGIVNSSHCNSACAPSPPSPTPTVISTSPLQPQQFSGATKGLFRRQINRHTSFTHAPRPNGLLQAKPVASICGPASTPPAYSPQRRTSFYDRSGTRLCRRNTVVGGSTPLYYPQPLSLRDIYRLSRQGSIRSRHSLLTNRRPSIQSRDESKAAGGSSSTPSRRTSSKASVSRQESKTRINDSRGNLTSSIKLSAVGATADAETRPKAAAAPDDETQDDNRLANSSQNLTEVAVCDDALAEHEDEQSVDVNAGSDKSTKESRFRLFLNRVRAFRLEPRGCCRTRIDYVLFIFPPSNRLHQFCCRLIAYQWFDNLVLIFIVLNCITLAMERPNIPPDSTERHFLTISNLVFTVIFAVEMFIKVMASGLIYGTHAYLRSGWNVMDGGLVLISLIDIFVSLTASHSPRIFGILRVFRLLRTLRPLRVISRAPGLKLVVQTLLSSLRPIGNIVLICVMFFVIFGILGVQLFKGSFSYCKTANITNIKTKNDCLSRGHEWKNNEYNFDNLGQALMTLFVLASRDGWVSIMYSGLDAVGVDMQPQENHNEWCLIYFISFLLLVGFFVLNMFVGVVVENFHKCRETQENEERALHAARRANKLAKRRRKMQSMPYWSEYSKGRLLLHTITNSKYFDLAIAGVIGVNVITMAMEFYMMPKELQFALKIFNFFFTSVFVIEAVVKIIAQGLIQYFGDKWNQLDIAIVILSIAGIVLEEIKSGFIPINPTIIRVMRVLRIARVLKLLKKAKSVRTLLDTVVQALPEVGNLALLFFLLFFIFAALGVELFGRIGCSVDRPCEGLSKHAHFRNFGMAFLTLFRVATGDNWNGIMKDTLRKNSVDGDDCDHNICLSHVIAPIYFVIFVLMAQFVLVNVVVAVLMKHLEESNRYEDEELDLDTEIHQPIENSELKIQTVDIARDESTVRDLQVVPSSNCDGLESEPQIQFTIRDVTRLTRHTSS